MATKKSDRFLRNITILLGLACMAIGCGPSSIAYLFMPFVDDRVQPKCKLANPDKEIKIIIASRFQNLEFRPEVQPAEQELASALEIELRKRFKLNNEKVKVEPPQRVRPHLTKMKEWNAASLIQVGERHFQADYVIELNIQSLSLMMPNSYNSLYQGRADLEVTVYDVHKPAIEAVILKQTFRSEYPMSQPIDSSTNSPDQFRARFNSRMARDLARWFTAYPSDEKFDIE
jgi:Lipopolysaccharide-assembly